MDDEIKSTMEELNFILKKKWTICVLTDLHLGSKHFQDFNNHLPEISTKVLHQTLTELEYAGLVNKTVIQEKPTITVYSLTDFPETNRLQLLSEDPFVLGFERLNEICDLIHIIRKELLKTFNMA